MSRQAWGEVPIPDRVAERAATRFRASGECQISTYSVASHGYAQIGWKDDEGVMRGTTAHRAAWVYHTGRQITPGVTIDHRQADGCTSRQCVRFEHLRELVNLENARRHLGRDWPVDGRCRHGHDERWWRPKGPTRRKGYCAACRSVLQQTRRGSKRRKTYT